MTRAVAPQQARAIEDELLFESLLQKCPNMRLLRQIHSRLLMSPLPLPSKSFALSKIVGFCALSPYGDIDHARAVFDRMPYPNIFSCNSLIRGYAQFKCPSKEPIFVYKRLIEQGHPNPNSFTMAFVLKACSVLSTFYEGRQIHSHVVRSGLGSSPFVQTGLMSFYAKCDEIGSARKVFDEIPARNLVAWSAMINGYAKLGMVNESLGLFREMQKAGVAPDEVTMVSVVTACAASGALELGKWVHAFMEKHVMEIDLELNTALVNMYAKCGSIERARKIFDEMPERDAKAWSSMIVGLAIHGLAEEALETFDRMLAAYVRPNQVTFIGVLSACAHGGLVVDGRRHWSMMLEVGIEPSMEHYGCVVDLLCRAGLIDDAYCFVEAMPILPNAVIWRTLLVGCWKKGVLDRGEIAAENLLELEPLNAENYLLISNLYASNSIWKKVMEIRKKMKENGMRAIPGCSSIEIDGFVHEFVVGDRSHPEIKDIREILREMSNSVRDAGHDPWTSNILHDVGEDEKESALCEHSERLAIAFGLLKTKAPVIIRVVKNLRVCGDCHEVTKVISKVYEREIIVRDRVRFHRFIDGTCSCKDYW
ncbi:hypothetical protein Syun_012602 [Stephania yunnanensis]|uniref:DYW domain-containing protein n=1 Tax=Stephania yunnanensis TaxID=152371 RepID=A0AAP0JZT3_9MAGN